MQQIERELTETGIPYASECLGGNIQGVRIGEMYIVEHGSGEGYYFGTLEDSEDVCYTLEEVLELAKKYCKKGLHSTVNHGIMEANKRMKGWYA